MVDVLAGIRVVDFSAIAAAPWATTLLALWGAEVIKVESLRKLDMSRTLVDPVTEVRYELDASPAFSFINVNKLSIRLNLRKPEGVKLARELVKISDVVVESFKPGTISKLGLNYELLEKIKPGIIMLSSSVSGQTGPDRQRPGYAPMFSALAGFGSLTGYEDGPPTEVRITIDFLSAVTSCFAILAALLYRQRTGVGQYIDVSSREAVACLVGEAFMDYSMNKRVVSRTGNRDDIMAPHNCYRCKGEDEWISIAIATESEWEDFCKAIGNPEWTKEARFREPYRRWQNQEELDRLVEGWTTNYDHYEVMHALQRVGIAAAPSFSGKDIYTDPHLAQREFSQVIQHPIIGLRSMIAPPWKFSETPPIVKRHGPLLGEHNDYIYGELLGLSRQQIEKLEEEGVID